MAKTLAVLALVLGLTSAAVVRAQEGPTIELAPSAGPAGTVVVVKGSGFQPGTVELFVDEVAEPPLASALVVRGGTFEVKFTIPPLKPGPHRTLACRDRVQDDTCRELAVASLEITSAPTTTRPAPTTTRPPTPTTTRPAPTTTRPPTITVAPTTTPSGTLVAATTTTQPTVGVVTTTSSTLPLVGQIGSTTTTSPIGELIGGTSTTTGDPPFDPDPQDLLGPTTTLPPAYQADNVENEHDIELTHIEVTQGLQNLANEFPLVEDRPTAVRVFGVSHGDVATLSSAWLEVSRDGAVLGIVEAENNPVQFTDTLVRASNDAAPYFLLDPAWLDGTLHLRAVAITGDPTLANDTNPADNFIETDATFHHAMGITVHMFPLYLTDDGTSGGGTPTIHTADDGWLLQGMATYRLWPAGHMVFDPYNPVVGNAGSGWDLTEDGSLSDPFPALAQVYAANGYDGNDLVLGMVSPSVTTEFGGGAQVPGTVSWAKMYANWSNTWPWHHSAGGVMAQELAHNVGLDHAPCDWNVGDPEPGELHGGAIDPLFPQAYSWPNCSIGPLDIEGFYGFDVMYQLTPTDEPSIMSNNPAVSPPLNATPFMGYAGTGKWLEPWHGCQLLQYLGVPCTPTDLIEIDDDTPGQGQGLPPIGHGVPVWTCDSWNGPGDEGDLCDFAPVEPFDPTALDDADADVLVLTSIDPDGGTASFDPGPVLDPKVVAEARSVAGRTVVEQPDGSAHEDEIDVHAVDWSLLDHGDDTYLLFLRDTGGRLLGVQTLDVGDADGALVEHEQHPGGSDDGDDGDAGVNPLLDPDRPHDHGVATLATRVPRLAGLASIEIVSPDGVVATLRPGAAAPVISSFDVDVTDRSATLGWVVSDPDGDPISLLVQYHTDGDWRTVSVPAGADTTELDLSTLPGGRPGAFRLLASDGIHGAVAVSDPVELADRAPFATILYPRDGSARPAGRLVELRGAATDPEDGDAAAIAWSSDRDGELGTGEVLGVSGLTQGTHRITMRAVDSAGNAGVSTITLVIGPSDLAPQEITDAVVEVLRTGVSAPAPGSSDGGGGVPWTAIALVAVLLAAGGLVFVLVRDRRRGAGA